MARGIQNFPNIVPADSDYPSGRIKDHQDGSPGTPVNQFTNGDLQEFFAKLMRLASITPNGSPDNEYSGHQYVDALETFVNNLIETQSETRAIGGSGNIPFAGPWFAVASFPRYTKHRNKIVTISCAVTGGTITATPQTIFTLPVGFRPSVRVFGPDNYCIITGSPTRPHGYCQVLANGDVQVFSDQTGDPDELWITITFAAV